MSRGWIEGLVWMYDIVLNEFEDTLRSCPDDLWEASMWDVSKDKGYWAPKPPMLENGEPDPRGIQVYSQFWHVAYHALFAHDRNLSERVPDWEPPAPFGKNDHDSGRLPPRTYTREELLAYAVFDYKKTMKILGDLTDDDAQRPTLAPVRGERPRLARVLIGNLAHTTGHHGTLETFIWQNRT